MRGLIAATTGGLFGAGLHLSGMTDTGRVQGFLDIFGDWDITLMFVMGAAIVPMAVAWRLTQNRQPFTGGSFPDRPVQDLDRKLVLGSVLFGIGWGLIGLCPGPALASISYGGWQGALFLGAMLVGMTIAPWAANRLDSTRPAQ